MGKRLEICRREIGWPAETHLRPDEETPSDQLPTPPKAGPKGEKTIASPADVNKLRISGPPPHSPIPEESPAKQGSRASRVSKTRDQRSADVVTHSSKRDIRPLKNSSLKKSQAGKTQEVVETSKSPTTAPLFDP